MKFYIFNCFLLAFSFSTCYAQSQLPQLEQGGMVPIINVHECGIQYFYDNAGNRILRTAVWCPNPPPAPIPPPEARMADIGDTSGTNTNNAAPVILIDTLGTYVNTKTDSTISKIELNVLAPNPTKGMIIISFNTELLNAIVTLFNNSGQQLYQSTVSGSQISLDLTNYAQGIYYVLIKVDKQTFNQKVVKQN